MNYADMQNIIQVSLWSTFETLEGAFLRGDVGRRQLESVLGSYGLLSEYRLWKEMEQK